MYYGLQNKNKNYCFLNKISTLIKSRKQCEDRDEQQLNDTCY